MITFRDMIYTESDLLKLNGIALVSLYNAIVGEIARLGTPDVALKPVNKFSDKGVAVKRTWNALQEYAKVNKVYIGEPETAKVEIIDEATPLVSKEIAEHFGLEVEPSTAETLVEVEEVAPTEEPVQPTPPETSDTPTEEVDAPKGRKPRLPRFVFPVKAVIKDCRPGTARAKAVELLSRPEGALFEEVAKATGWDTFKKCYEGIRILHFYLGYGMRQDDKGRIYLRTK